MDLQMIPRESYQSFRTVASHSYCTNFDIPLSQLKYVQSTWDLTNK